MAVDFESVQINPVTYTGYSPKIRPITYLWRITQGTGTGYLAGTYPDGVTTVEGVPVPATVRVLLRSTDPAFDGLFVSEVSSNVDGTWRVDGLNPNLKYDVVGRKDGFNDVIMANVSPATD